MTDKYDCLRKSFGDTIALSICVDYLVAIKRQRKPKGQSKIDISEKLAHWVHKTQDEDNNTKTHHNMCWTPLYANKHK